MKEGEGKGKPTLEELRRVIDSPIQTTGRFNLTPNVALAIPQSETEEDSKIALRELANGVFEREKGYHPKLKTNREMMRFIQKDTFKWDYAQLASYLGLSRDQVKKFDRIGIKEKQLDKFRERFEGLFAIGSILLKHVDEAIDRKGALVTPNGLLSDLGVGEIIKAGRINTAVSITERTFKKFHEEN